MRIKTIKHAHLFKYDADTVNILLHRSVFLSNADLDISSTVHSLAALKDSVSNSLD